MKKKKPNFKLMPTDKKGNDIDWFHGWSGIEKLTKALGKTWIDVGELIEDNWVDRTSFHQIMLCQAVHKSLNKKHNKPRLKVGPKGLENDMHYAIRMDYKNIKQLYSKCGKVTDIYKAVSQMYQRVYKARKRWVEAYLYDLN